MSQIQWDPELSVGVKEVDDQHKELIRIANTLLAAVDKGGNRAITENALKKLRDYTVFHFNSEERLMREKQYPKLSDHVARHARLKLDVKDFQRSVYEGKIPTPAKVLAFLREWLLNHILTYDRDFARYLKDLPKEETWATVSGK